MVDMCRDERDDRFDEVVTKPCAVVLRSAEMRRAYLDDGAIFILDE